MLAAARLGSPPFLDSYAEGFEGFDWGCRFFHPPRLDFTLVGGTHSRRKDTFIAKPADPDAGRALAALLQKESAIRERNLERSAKAPPQAYLEGKVAPYLAVLERVAPPFGSPIELAVSAALFAVGFYVILSARYDAATVNWAHGLIGTAVGFWLKHPKSGA
ncbi:MAG: hypothetical protein HY791_28900 [Deltaproteobacteria bacterium]|nr:hypothetical protein [Deltaproteobacteria bacterium]